MLDRENIRGKVVALFVLGCMLFSYPVLTLFNVPVLLLGVPLLFVYIFLAWLVFIALVFAFAHTHLRSRRADAALTARPPDQTD
jgi:hypothetical protein